VGDFRAPSLLIASCFACLLTLPFFALLLPGIIGYALSVRRVVSDTTFNVHPLPWRTNVLYFVPHNSPGLKLTSPGCRQERAPSCLLVTVGRVLPCAAQWQVVYESHVRRIALALNKQGTITPSCSCISVAWPSLGAGGLECKDEGALLPRLVGVLVCRM
jgi:hypothetical protein